ncbi:hypothetical protein BC940DRAFT_360726 [Gongronella butleri]|nr:hypothetical protein BC940DRAFT_360726 [Gongronella butleri]
MPLDNHQLPLERLSKHRKCEAKCTQSANAIAQFSVYEQKILARPPASTEQSPTAPSPTTPTDPSPTTPTNPSPTAPAESSPIAPTKQSPTTSTEQSPTTSTEQSPTAPSPATPTDPSPTPSPINVESLAARVLEDLDFASDADSFYVVCANSKHSPRTWP